MIIDVSTGPGRQWVVFSDGTYLEFQVVEGEIVVNSTSNKYIAGIYNSGIAFHIDLNEDTIRIGGDVLRFKA